MKPIHFLLLILFLLGARYLLAVIRGPQTDSQIRIPKGPALDRAVREKQKHLNGMPRLPEGLP